MQFFAPCPPGAEACLENELQRLGASDVVPGSRGVAFSGDLLTAYRVSVGARTASRLLLELFSGEADDEDELYRLAGDYPWEGEFDSRCTMACRVTGVPAERDPRFAVLRLKDGIADRFRSVQMPRPDVERRSPDVRIEARWDGRRVTGYLNWSGAPLHERGYRLERTDAVLRETTAAAVVALAGWEALARSGGCFVDPVCGSGTLLAEAAFMAMNAAPGVHRKLWGFSVLKRHDEPLWDEVLREARIHFGKALTGCRPFLAMILTPVPGKPPVPICAGPA